MLRNKPHVNEKNDGVVKYHNSLEYTSQPEVAQSFQKASGGWWKLRRIFVNLYLYPGTKQIVNKDDKETKTYEFWKEPSIF